MRRRKYAKKSALSGAGPARVLMLVLLMLLGSGCTGQTTPPSPSGTEPSVIPTSTPTAATAQPLRTVSPTASSSPTPTAGAAGQIAPTRLSPAQTPAASVSIEPSDEPGGPTEPTSVSPAPPVSALTLPMNTPLMPPPTGQPNIPLMGVTTLAVFSGDPAYSLLAAGTNGSGVLISQNGGVEWHWRTAGLPADDPINSLAFGPGELIAVAAAGGAYRSGVSQEEWEPVAGLEQGVDRVVYSPSYGDDGTMFAVQNGAMVRSGDRGNSWSAVLPSNGCPLNIVFSPYYAVDTTAFAPRCDHLVRSTDGGLSWVHLPVEGEAIDVGHLANVQALPGHFLAQGTTQGMPLHSTDGGRTWQKAYDVANAPFALGSLFDVIGVTPAGTIFAAGRSHMYDSETTVWRSDDWGRVWYPVARTAGVGRLVALASDAVWLATFDGVFFDGGHGWRLLHPGGNRPELAGLPTENVAVARRGVSKYTSRLYLFERHGQWQPMYVETTNKAALRAFPSPNYQDEPLVIILAQDYGGLIWALTLRPQVDPPLVVVEAIPAGPGQSLDRYRVVYGDDYSSSGRVEIRHGYSGALYISEDRGYSWIRPDPAVPGACERNPVSGFGALWFGNDVVRSRLLCPLDDEQPYAGTVQPYEHGELLLLDSVAPAAERQVYALIPDWPGEPGWTTLPHYATVMSPLVPPDGLLAPDPDFYTAWAEGYCCRPDAVPASQALGWATSAVSSVEVAVQHFEGGTLIWRGDRDEILVLEQLAERDVYSVWPD